MKTKHLIFVLLFGLFLACSKDDGPRPQDPDPIEQQDLDPEPKLSSEKQIISFRFVRIDNAGVTVDIPGEIDLEAKTIAAEMPSGTEVLALEPEVEISDKATYEPTGPQDFTKPINYTVTAEDGTRTVYTATVNITLTDKEILLLISEVNPRNALNWNKDDDISDWKEVKLNDNGDVVNLILETDSLTVLPPEIGQLITLEILSLSDNQLDVLPPEIGQLSHLKHLFLGGNKLGDLPSEIWQLVNLTTLDLGNNLMSSIPAEIGQLGNLENLYLQNNDELDTLPVEVWQLVNLTDLWLSHNEFASIPPEIGQLSNLKDLHLQYNFIENIPPELGLLSGLEKLRLADNGLTTIPIEVCNLDVSRGGETQVDIVPGVLCEVVLEPLRSKQ